MWRHVYLQELREHPLTQRSEDTHGAAVGVPGCAPINSKSIQQS